MSQKCFSYETILFSLSPKHWQTCILVNKQTIFWDKYSSNIYGARGSYITFRFVIFSSPFIWCHSKKTASGPSLLTANEEAQVQWKRNLVFTMSLWIHKQNLYILSIHDTIFSCKFSFKISASGNVLIVSSSPQFSLGTYFYHCTQSCPPTEEGTWRCFCYNRADWLHTFLKQLWQSE